MSRKTFYNPSRVFDPKRSSGRPKKLSSYMRNNTFPTPYKIGDVFLKYEDEQEISCIVIKNVVKNQKNKSYKYHYDDKIYIKYDKNYDSTMWRITFQDGLKPSLVEHNTLEQMEKIDNAKYAKIILAYSEEI